MSFYFFIDGTNLYASQYELFGPKQYLYFPEFIKEIENNLKIKFDKIYFYASYSPHTKNPTIKEKLYLKNEALFYKSVKQTKNTFFFTGYRSKTSGKEKEVDVKLAVDIVDFAHLKKYDRFYLFSGDADFMHALKIANRLGKKSFIIATENRIPIRFTYNYLTYLFVFNQNRKKGVNINNKQKIKLIYLNDKGLIKEV